MVKKNIDLWGIIALTCLAVLAALIPVSGGLRTLIVIPLVLFLPGYALTAALFPGHRFGIPERLTFSVGLSLCLGVLGGLVLNWTTWGLQAGSWAIWFGNVTLAASAVGLVRRFRYPLHNPVRISLSISIPGLLMLTGAFVLTVLAFNMAAMGASAQQQQTPFSQLWLIPVDESSPDMIRIGVRNSEFTAMSYRLQLKRGATVIHEWSTLQLDPGGEWTQALSLDSQGRSFEADLYRLDDPEHIYRKVILNRAD